MPSVTVTVDEKGVIHCKPDPVDVKGKSPPIEFTLATPGYEFPATGAVVMKTPSPDFPEAAQRLKPQLVTLVDLNKTKGLYHYAVTVVNTASKQSIELDPGINNEGGGG
ncbi:MAG: hypothetical protein JNM26_16665 [Ideonella sp.]|nr:hypothetical protein [Ideonella sp.]